MRIRSGTAVARQALLLVGHTPADWQNLVESHRTVETFAFNPTEPRDEERSARHLEIEPVAREAVELGSRVRALHFPNGLRELLERVGHEVISLIRPGELRPVVVIETQTDRLTLGPEDLSIPGETADAASLPFEIVRGRCGPQILASGVVDVARNGWSVPTTHPIPLADGDTIDAAGEHYLVHIIPPGSRKHVGIGSVTLRSHAQRPGAAFLFAIEPEGKTIGLEFDGPTLRALVDLAIGGDGARAFDHSPLSDVEYSVAEWVVHRYASILSVLLFQGTASLRPVGIGAVTCDVACAAAVRIGAYQGVASIVTNLAGLSSISTAIDGGPPTDLSTHPVAVEIEFDACIRLPLGEAQIESLASLARGDLVISRDFEPVLREGWTAAAVLTLEPGGHLAHPVRASMTDGRLRVALEPGPNPWRSRRMEPDETATAVELEQFADGIGSITVPLSAEIARRRASVRELLTLKPGDVLDFQRPITTEVRLFANGAPVALGELVDVEGSLGVRITRLGGSE